jgi:hypothetical protein
MVPRDTAVGRTGNYEADPTEGGRKLIRVIRSQPGPPRKWLLNKGFHRFEGCRATYVRHPAANYFNMKMLRAHGVGIRG